MKTKKYEEVIKNHEVKPNYLKNAAVSFLFGGLICVGGQLLIEMYIHWFGFVRDTASTLALVTVILLASILTGLGFYDEFGQIAKAGAFVPITGFANSLTSAALESKSEGIITGILSCLLAMVTGNPTKPPLEKTTLGRIVFKIFLHSKTLLIER